MVALATKLFCPKLNEQVNQKALNVYYIYNFYYKAGCFTNVFRCPICEKPIKIKVIHLK